jgi:hypothetical protein
MRWPVLAAVTRVGLAVLGGALLMDMAGLGLTGQFIAVALDDQFDVPTAIGQLRRNTHGLRVAVAE